MDGLHFGRAMARVLEENSCTLCELGLGKKPELTFDWVGKYAGDRLDNARRGVRSWDALGLVRKTSLRSAKSGLGKDAWNSQDILTRYQELSSWAQRETEKLLTLSKNPATWKAANKTPAYTRELISVLREDLVLPGDGPFRGKLDYLEDLVKEETGRAEDTNPSATALKEKQLADAAAELKSMGPAERAAYLRAAFDNNTAAGQVFQAPGSGATGSAAGPRAATGGPIVPVPMTKETAKKLGEEMFRMGETGKPEGYLADVLGETGAGKRTLAFYGDPGYAKAGTNKLDFAFESMNAWGYWNANKKIIRLSSEAAEEFAALRGKTVPQLMQDKAAMKDLAVYLSPTMVHEPEHQNQTARAIASGTDFVKYSEGSTDPYTRAKENLANTESAKHMIEYCSRHGGGACYARFSEMHADSAERFMADGVRALDTLKAPLYPKTDSFEGGAAREFNKAELYAKQVSLLAAKEGSDPDSMSADEVRDLREYRELMRTRFKWYTIIYRENAANDAAALAFRNEYRSKSGLPVPAL